MEGVAFVIALAVAFFIAPIFYGATISAVRDFAFDQYGRGWEDTAAFLWMLVSGLLVYFVARSLASVALIKLGIAAFMTR